MIANLLPKHVIFFIAVFLISIEGRTNDFLAVPECADVEEFYTESYVDTMIRVWWDTAYANTSHYNVRFGSVDDVPDLLESVVLTSNFIDIDLDKIDISADCYVSVQRICIDAQGGEVLSGWQEFIFTPVFIDDKSKFIQKDLLIGDCVTNSPNLLADYNPDFSAPLESGLPPGFRTDNRFNASRAGRGLYTLITSRNWGACRYSPQFDNTSGDNTGRYLWYDTGNRGSTAWKPYDPTRPTGLENLIDVEPNTDYVFSFWVRDIARNSDCRSGGAPRMAGSINGVQSPSLNLGAFTDPCCPEWKNICMTWNSGAATTALLEVKFLWNVGWTDVGIDDMFFGRLLPDEICNNDIDDDGDGLVDCDDSDCNQISLDGYSISDPVTCPSNDNGSVVIFASGGESLEYSLDGVNFSSSFLFEGLSPGNYNVTIRNENGCLSLFENAFTLDGQAVVSLLSNPIVVDATCPFNNNGSISFEPAEQDYLYSIDNGATFQAESEFLNLEAGMYSVIIENEFGCSLIEEFEIGEEVCIENCTNGTDDDGDGLVDCDDGDCGPIDISIGTIENSSCPLNNDGSVVLVATGENLSYSIDFGLSFQRSPIFTGLTPGTYDVVIRNSDSGCLDASLSFTIIGETCFEICGNGLDDDGDGNIDCDDGDCSIPIISEVVVVEPDCPFNDGGSIAIDARGSELEYSIDNGASFQSLATFSDLEPGSYVILVKSGLHGCLSSSKEVLLTEKECFEICNNNLDDDGDGLIDGEDSDCGQLSFNGVEFTIATTQNCPNPNDGEIDINATGGNIQYSIDGGATFYNNSKFKNLEPRDYHVVLRSNLTDEILDIGLVTLESELCIEICDNEIDDDGDGLLDCEDDDCAFANTNDVVCTLSSEFIVTSLGLNTALVTLENANQSNVTDILISSSFDLVELFISFTSSTDGSIVETKRVLADNQNLDISTWSVELNDVAYDTDINVVIGLSTQGECPRLCSIGTILSIEPVSEEVIVIEETNPIVEIEDYACGDPFTIPQAGTNSLNGKLPLNRLITIFDFPVKLESLTDDKDNGDGFSGLAVIPLPFNKRTVKVEFSEIRINKDYQVFDGIITAQGNDNVIFESIDATSELTVDICQVVDEEGCPIDPYGFDCDGIHQVTMTIYDELNFRKDGSYLDTGQPFNDKGCSRDNRDENGDICFAGDATSQFVADFIEDNADDIETITADELNTLVSNLTAEQNQQAASCNIIRGDMNGLFSSLETGLGLTRNFVFGENEEFFEEGMSNFFENAPSILNDEEIRNDDVRSLESLHVDLYSCDLILEEKKEELARIARIQLEEFDILLSFILQQLSALSDVDIQAFNNDPLLLSEWIAERLSEYNDNTETGIGWNEQRDDQLMNKRISIEEIQISPSWASTKDAISKLSNEDKSREIHFQLEQGVEYIGGIHRAFYLEEIARMNEENPETNGLLPISIENEIFGVRHRILIDRVSLTPSSAIMDAFIILDDPKNEHRRMVFRATNVEFTPAGFASNVTQLSLVNDFEIRLSDKIKLILNKDVTQASWDCNGFAGLSLNGDVEICRDVVIPVSDDLQTIIPDPERYRANFSVFATSWQDVLITADAPAFAVAANDGFRFTLEGLVVDLSSVKTPAFILPPEGYVSPFYDDVNRILDPKWEGFYFQRLAGTAPFFKKRDGSLVGIEVNEFLGDSYGLSGTISGTNILPLSEGAISGWGAGIDELGVRILQNKLVAAEIRGDLLLPVVTEPIGYEGIWYGDNNFSLAATIANNQNYPFFLGQLELLSGTGARFTSIDGNQSLSAELHGNLLMGSGGSGSFGDDSGMIFPSVSFKNFIVTSDPAIDLGTWKIDGLKLPKFSVFGVGIDNVAKYNPGGLNEVGLNFPLQIDLAKSIGLTAQGDVGLVSGLDEDADVQKWEFKRVELNRFFIDQDIKDRIRIVGDLSFFRSDPIYGNGFRGALCASFADLNNLEIGAVGQFGKILNDENNPDDDLNHFFVDGLVSLPIDIPLGPISIYGFGGGASFNMENNFDITTVDFAGIADGEGICGSVATLPIGNTLSGITYTPSTEIGLGLRATTLLKTGSEKIFNGSASLEFLFNNQVNGGGINKISFLGNGHLLAAVNPNVIPLFEKVNSTLGVIPDPPVGRGVFSAYVDLSLSPSERIFNGLIETYLNTPFLRGPNPKGLACAADIYFSPERWHIFLGTPKNRCGLEFNLLDAITANFGSYFDIGTDLPPPAELPQEVQSIFNKNRPDQGLRNSGAGFMFGSNLDFRTQLSTLGTGVALKMILGFDIMVRDYGDANCRGSDGPIGVDGWYASGQVYGYLEAAVTVLKVKILRAGVAALLQARLPNPFWARAALAVKAKILFVPITVNLDITVGEECYIESDSDSPLGYDIITFAIPEGGARAMETSVQPEVFFSVPINRPFELINEQGESVTYIARIKEITVNSANQGPITNFIYELDNSGLSAKIRPLDFLPGDDEISYTVKVEVERNGEAYPMNEESETFTFNTLPEISYIPEANVSYSYPLNGMYDFYKNEDNRSSGNGMKGVIELTSGQPTLFNNLDEGEEVFVKLERFGFETQILPVEYKLFESRVEFPLENLENEGVYRYSLIKRENDTQPAESPLYGPVYFRVSIYNTFNEKINAINSLGELNANGVVTLGEDVSTLKMLGVEPFGLGHRPSDEDDFTFASYTLPERNLNSWYENKTIQVMNEAFEFGALLEGCSNGLGFVDINSSRTTSVTDEVNFEGFSELVVDETMFENPGLGDFRNMRWFVNYLAPQLIRNEYDRFRDRVLACYPEAGSVCPPVDQNGPGGVILIDGYSNEIAEFMCSPWISSKSRLPTGFKVNTRYNLPHVSNRQKNDILFKK